MLPNCPITKADIIRTEEILGPNLGSLKGKTTRTKPSKVIINTFNDLPTGMLDKHGKVTLAVDIMYIAGIPFIMTTSWAIHFGTAELIKTEKISTIMIAMKQVIEAYEARGFRIRYILADGQFEHAQKHIEQMGIILNLTSRDEHVPEIEHYIRMVKERVRAIVHTLPFKQYPNRLIVETVYNTVFWLNCFPHKDGIHTTLSPRTIITGSTIDYNKHCTLQFSTYVQVHEPHNNSLLPRTTGAIALRPSGNKQGGHYFMSLTTGKRVIRNKWTVLPMPAAVIATVHQLAATCKKYKGIVFTDKNGNIINDDDDDDDDNNENNTLEITGVDETNNINHTNTEMDTTNNNNTNNNNTLEITGVHNNTAEMETTNEPQNINNEPYTAHIHTQIMNKMTWGIIKTEIMSNMTMRYLLKMNHPKTYT